MQIHPITSVPDVLRRSLLFEVMAGTVVARIAAGDELVVMKRTI